MHGRMLTGAGPQRGVLPRTRTPSCHCGRTVLAPAGPGNSLGATRLPPLRAGAAAALPCGANRPWGDDGPWESRGLHRRRGTEGAGQAAARGGSPRQPAPATLCHTSLSQPRSQSKGGLALTAHRSWHPKPHRWERGNRPRSASPADPAVTACDDAEDRALATSLICSSPSGGMRQDRQGQEKRRQNTSDWQQGPPGAESRLHSEPGLQPSLVTALTAQPTPSLQSSPENRCRNWPIVCIYFYMIPRKSRKHLNTRLVTTINNRKLGQYRRW